MQTSRAVPDAYEVEKRALTRRRTVVAGILAVVLVPLFGSIDYFMYRPHFAVLAEARLLSALASAAILFLLRGPIGERHASWLGVVLALEVGTAIGGVPVYVTGVNTPHYVSLVLLVLSLAMLLPWSSWQIGFLSTSLAAMYVVGVLAHGPLHSGSVFVAQVSAILVTGVLALVSTVLSEQVRRKEFATRAALQASAEEKTGLISVLEDRTAKLEGVNAELANLNQEMEDLMYVASHDLRAPLINVQGFANEVTMSLADVRRYTASPEADPIYADIAESLRFIQSAIGRMDSLINALLDLSRVSARSNPTETIHLRDVVERIVESFRYQLDRKQIDVGVGALPSVRGDAPRLTQVFSNLIDNAIKYMGDRPRRAIEIGVRHDNGTPTFFVKDSGPGIPLANRETVFRLFRRLGNGVPGEGIGLTMVRKIIQTHGGRIWVESAPGEGSTFCFTLPTAVADHTESPAHVQ